MKRRPWMPAREAARILREREIDPIDALSSIIRDTGQSGINRSWAIANPVVIRPGTNSWLTSPEIDVEAGTIVVPQRVLGRRTPEDRPEPLLINPFELDRRHPVISNCRPIDPDKPERMRIDEYAFKVAFKAKVEEEGRLPHRDNEVGWQRQSDAEKWAHKFLLDAGTPLSEEPVRRRIRKLIEEMKAGGNSPLN